MQQYGCCKANKIVGYIFKITSEVKTRASNQTIEYELHNYWVTAENTPDLKTDNHLFLDQ